MIQHSEKCALSLAGAEGGNRRYWKGTRHWKPVLLRQRDAGASLQGTEHGSFPEGETGPWSGLDASRQGLGTGLPGTGGRVLAVGDTVHFRHCSSRHTLDGLLELH